MFRIVHATMRLAPMLAAGLFCAAAAAQNAGSDDPIRSGCEVDYPPFCIVHEDGRADGFAVELMRAALAKMGREVTFRTGPWKDVRGWLERGEVEALPLVGRTPEREALFDFTVPYLTMHGAIVVRKDTADVQVLDDLHGRRVGVMAGDNAEEFLRREDRGFEIVTTPTFTKALQALSEGRCDAVVVQRLVAIRLLKETGLDHLKIVDRPIPDFSQDWCFAVKEGNRETLALLNEGLALTIADGTHRRLHAKWFAALELPSDRPIVIGGDHNYPPFEFLDEQGRPAGYNVDLSRAIARAMGLRIEFRLGPWPEIVRGMEDGQIDLLQGMFYLPERDLKFDFTPPHTVHHYVGVVRKGEGDPPTELDDLAGKRIVVQRRDAAHDFLGGQGLEGQVALAETQADVLRELAEGRHDCALAVRISSLHLIQKRGWKNLVLGRQAFLPLDYCYAAPNGHKAILAQFSEGLKVLEESGEYRRIYEKWLGVYEQGIPSRTVLKYIALIAGPMLLIAVLALLWSWGLRKQVAWRTAELATLFRRHQAILEDIPDIVMEVDIHKVYVWANAAGYAFFGDDVIGNEASHYFDGEQNTYRTVKPVFAGNENVVYAESLQRRRDGESRLLAWWCRVLKDKTGNVIGAISTARDITEQRQAEEKMARQYRLLRVAGATTRFGGWSVDLATNICTWSDIVAEIHGMPHGFSPQVEEDIAFYAPEWREKIKQVFTDCAECGVPYDEEMEILTRSGERVWVRTAAEAIRDNDGRIVQVQGSFQDITTRKRQAARIEHLNRVLRAIRDVNQLITHEDDRTALLHRSCDILISTRGYRSAWVALRDADGKFQAVSESGIGADFDAVRKKIEQGDLPECLRLVQEAVDGVVVIHDTDRTCNCCALARAYRDTAALAGALRHGGRDYGALVVALPAGLAEDAEEQSLFRELVGDVAYALYALETARRRRQEATAREKLQAQLLQAQKMESVGRLAGGVAHDFNNMLMGIMGYTELCQGAIGTNHQVREWLDEIGKAAERSANLTRQLLAFARKQTVAPKVIDLNTVVGNMLMMLCRLIGEDMDLTWQPAVELWPVKIDPGQIDQILANLCVNARDAIAMPVPPGKPPRQAGKVTIETANVFIDADYCAANAEATPGTYVRLAVSDNGCGMDRETLKNIFEPFFTTKGVGEGTGLGLAMVYGIVKQNNGFVTVYSELGQGTTCSIHLPREAQEQAEEIAVMPTNHPGGTETILLVEDEISIRVTMCMFLEQFGYTVLSADCPGAAIDLAAEHTGVIDLLITDVVMPVMNGRELAAKLLVERPSMKVLYMSGYTANVIAHRGILDEGMQFLSKPIGRAALARKVREILG